MNNLLEQDKIVQEIRQFGSWIPAQRKHAEQRLREAGPDAITPLLAVLEQERSRRARRVQLSGWVAGVGLSGILVICIVWMVTSLLGQHWRTFPIHAVQDLYLGTMGWVGILAKPTRLQKRTARALLGVILWRPSVLLPRRWDTEISGYTPKLPQP